MYLKKFNTKSSERFWRDRYYFAAWQSLALYWTQWNPPKQITPINYSSKGTHRCALQIICKTMTNFSFEEQNNRLIEKNNNSKTIDQIG